jgi:hypothetical protein
MASLQRKGFHYNASRQNYGWEYVISQERDTESKGQSFSPALVDFRKASNEEEISSGMF